MAFNSREYDWADVTLLLAGSDITGIRAVKYAVKAEKEAIHAKGRKPHSIGIGNYGYTGEFEILQSDYEALVAAAPNRDILQLSLDALVNFGNPPSALITDRLVGISFEESAKDIKQGDKAMYIKLPFLMLDVENQI